MLIPIEIRIPRESVRGLFFWKMRLTCLTLTRLESGVPERTPLCVSPPCGVYECEHNNIQQMRRVTATETGTHWSTAMNIATTAFLISRSYNNIAVHDDDIRLVRVASVVRSASCPEMASTCYAVSRFSHRTVGHVARDNRRQQTGTIDTFLFDLPTKPPPPPLHHVLAVSRHSLPSEERARSPRFKDVFRDLVGSTTPCIVTMPREC